MKGSTRTGILLMILCTFFTAAGQFYFKSSSRTFAWGIAELATNYNLLLGLFFYAIGAGLMILALRFGELSVIYPFVSLTFIWVMFISGFLFGEKITLLKLGSIAFIVTGVAFIGRGSRHG